jgi:hypothetical protein
MASIGFIQSELDLKLLILYILSKAVGPITFWQLLDLALCDAGVDYFSLSQAVGHMVETGQLSREGERYSLTEKGRRNSEICETSLPYSVRLHCDENLVKVNAALRQEAQVQVDTVPNEDGTCTLRLHLNDAVTPMLQMELLVPDPSRADGMAKRFRQDPAGFYYAVTQLLSQPENQNKEDNP